MKSISLGSSCIWYGNKISRSEELEAKSIQNKTIGHKTTVRSVIDNQLSTPFIVIDLLNIYINLCMLKNKKCNWSSFDMSE